MSRLASLLRKAIPATLGMACACICILSGARAQAETITTGYAGGSSQQGIMFDVMAAYEIDISHISVNLQASGTTCRVYYRQGSHVGHTASDDGWELIATRTVTGTPGQASDPIELELPPTLPAGKTASFYITSATPGVSLNCSNDAGGGSVQTTDGFITIYKGTGLQYPFTNGTGTTSPSKLANATLHYSYRPAYFWKGQSSNVWSGANWASDTSGTAASGVPGIEHPVIFSANGAANRNVTLNAATTIRNLVMKDSVPVTIGGTGTLNFRNESSNDVITASGGSVMTISAPIVASTDAQSTHYTVATGSELVIAGNFQPFYMNKAGGGLMRLTGTLTSNDYTLTVDGGAFTVDGGTANFGNAGVAVGSAGDGTLNIINGGTISSRDVDVGVGAGGNASVIGASSVWNQNFCSVGRITPGAFSVSGGATINSSRVYVGSISSGSIQVTGVGSTWNASAGVLVAFDVGGTGTVTVENGALISTNQIELGNNGGTATLQLNGSASPGRGVIRAGAIVRQGGTSVINFNGGKLEATGSESNYLQNLPSGAITLQSGGFYMDTKAFNVGIQSVMGGSGPLVKQGSGTLTLTGANSFTGETTIEAGTLALPSASSLASTAVRITGGGKLSGEGTLSGNCFLTTGSLQPGTAGMQAGGLRWATTGGLTAKLGTTATPLRLTGTAIRDGSGPLTLTLEDAGYVLNQAYTLMTFSSTTLTASDIVVAGGIPGTLQVLATSIRFTPLTPTLEIDDQTVDEGNSGSTTMTFHVTLSIPAPAGGVTFDYATQADTAASPSDFTAASGSVTIPAGSSAATIVVTINGDTVVEGNEAFSMNLSNVSGATVLDGSGRGTIRNDDTATVTMSPVSVSESNISTTNMIFTASLDNAVQGGFTVNYATADGTATTADGDYTATSGTLTFTGSAGQTRTIVVVSNGDTKVEANETFSVTLGTITGSAPAGAITASGNTGTITNNDSVTISLSPVTQNEGSGGGTTNFTFTATASNAVQGGFSVAYSTADGTAIAGSDYTSASGILTFSGLGGETQTVTVTVTPDSNYEPDETFAVSLGSISGTSLDSSLFTRSGSTGTIVNDDAQPPSAVATSVSGTTLGGNDGKVTPGEIVTFTTRITVPEGTTPDLRIIHNLPPGMAFVPGSTTLVPGSYGGTLPAPTVAPVTGSQYLNGTDVQFSFASISNAPDADSSNDSFGVTWQAVVLDAASNVGLLPTQTGLTVTVSDNGGSGGVFTSPAVTGTLTVVEPGLAMTHGVTATSGDAGDTVTYTITLRHNSSSAQAAYDVALSETLPTGLSPVAGSLAAILSNGTTNTNYAGAFSLSGQNLTTISPFNLAQDEVLTLTLQAVLTGSVTPNQSLTTTATAGYSSYIGNRTAAGGFNPNGDVTTDKERAYTASADATVTVNAGSASWALESTNQTHTTGSNVTIGEQATYRATVTLPEGTTSGLSLAAILPAGMQYVPGSVTVDSSGFNGTVPMASVSTGGGNGDDVTVTFGSISATGDNVTGNNSFSVLISARVMDVPGNSNGTMLSTQLGFDITGDNIAQATSPAVDLTVLQPAPTATLSIAESNASPGGQVTFTLTLSNSAAALTGYGPAIQVLLPATGFDSSTISFGTEGTDFPAGFQPTTTGNMINYTSPSGTSLAGGDTLSFTFRVNLLSTLSSGSVVTANAATGSLSTLPGVVSGERTFSPVSGTDTISISNPAPTAITLTGGSIAENNSPGASVGTLSATDNAGDTASFSVVAGADDDDNASFTIDGTSLKLTPSADYETKPTYKVRIQVTDSASQTFSKAFLVTITNANDTPVATAQSLLSVDEDGSLPVTLSGTDQDNDTLTYSISTGPSHGSLSGTAPNFTYIPAADYNGTDSFQFTASDASATSLPATISITVNAVNDAPTLAVITSPAAIDEDASQQTIALSGIAAGGGETQALTITAVSDNPSLIPNPAVTYTSPAATGSLAYTPVANASGTAIITVTVNDGQATNNTVSRTFTVTVNAVNDAPTLAAITSPVAIDEDAAQQTIALSGISAGPGETQTLTITAVSDNPSLIPNPAVTYTNPSTTGSLAYTPVANASGTATITVTVNDGQATNNTVSRTFTVTVNAVNDVPSFTKGADQTEIFGANTARTVTGWATNISDGDPQMTQALAFSVTVSSGGGIFTTAPAISGNGTLTYTPNGTAGTATISVTLTDDATAGGAALTSLAQTFTITTAPQADYLVTTSAGVMTVKDNSGNSDTLAVTQSTTGTIRFASTGRNFSINGGSNISGNSGDLPLAGITSIVIQAQGGNDVVSLGTVAGMPSLGVTGGDGADTVSVAGVLTFLADASLTTESEALLTTAGASVITSGSGTIRFNVDEISLDPASSIASARYVRINQFTGTRLISLGLEQTGKLSLTDAELDTITSPAAQIGQGLYPEAAYASIAVTASISPAGINTLLLYCRETITCSPGASVTVPKLGLQSSNENVGTEAQPLLTQVGTIEISATGGIIVSNTGPVTIGGIGFILTEPKPIGMLVGYQNPIKVASTGTMTVSGYLFGGSGGPITLSATGAGSDVVIQSGKPPTISGVTGGQVSISAGRDILVGTAVARGDTEGGSGLTLTAGRDVIVDAGSIIKGGGSGVNVTAGRNLGMPGNIAAGANISSFSPISITANLVTIGQGGTSSAIGSLLGTLNLTTDALEITSPGTHAVLTPGSILAIKPRTAGRPITLGGAPEAGSLQILQSVLDRISGGSFLTIGDPASGNVTLKSAINRTADSIDITTGGSVDFSGGSIQTTATILTFNCPAGTFRPWSAGEDAGTTQASGIITPNGKVSLRLNGTAPDTGYDQLKIRGKVSLGLFPLELTGSHVPLAGQSFTLIDNDGTDAVDGTFSGLPQGATLTFNGVLMRINYAGGDGNDVVLALANFAPTDIALSPSSINENNAPGATVGTLTATDPDVTDTHTFSLVTGTGDTNNSSFTISGNQLKLSLAADYETKASYSVRLRADDGRGGTYDKALTVIINNINDAPVISSIAGRFTDEDTATAAIPFTISDQDAGAVLTLSVQTSDPSVAALSGIVLGGTGANRTVTVIPVANASGSSTITIKVSDGTLESSTAFLLTVNAVNDGPVVSSPIPDVLQTKPGLTTSINMEEYFTDVETSSSGLAYIASYTAPSSPFFTMVRRGNILDITGTAPGELSIWVAAADPSGLGANTSFRYKVKAIPQVVGTGIPDTELSPASTGLDIDLSQYFSDADGDAISYGILTNTEPGKVSATITGSTLTLDPLADGSSILVITATDSDGNTTSDSFVVTVPKPVPTLTPTVGFTPHLNRQTGLYEIAVTATNGNRFDVPGFRLRVTSALPAGIRLWNSTGPAGSNEPYLDVLTRTAPGQSVTVILEFHSATRNFDGFNPTIIAEPLPDTVSDTGTGAGIAVTLFRVLPDGSTLLEFTSEPGEFYQIEYSSDLANWKKSLVPIQAGANRVQWIDRGAPYTDSHPSTVGSRYYRVSRINNN